MSFYEANKKLVDKFKDISEDIKNAVGEDASDYEFFNSIQN